MIMSLAINIPCHPAAAMKQKRLEVRVDSLTLLSAHAKFQFYAY